MNQRTHMHENMNETSPVGRAAAMLTHVLEELVDDPSGVHVGALEGQQAVIFEVAVTADDVRRVIGRRGRTADALRDLLLNLGSKHGRRFLLEILEPPEEAGRRPAPAGSEVAFGVQHGD